MRKLFDTHKKGANPSKVTAIVAACAMLLTVTVTGTAVALESAADPANQNDQSQTVQQNDGTAADAQTANDAATDQTANGTEATQPTDGNAQGDAVQSDGTAQNDATAETDPAQSGDAAQQGVSTTQQDATENNDVTATTDIAKQAAPAPAADASAAAALAANIGTVGTVDSQSAGISINLHDYDLTGINYTDNGTQYRESARPLTFAGGNDTYRTNKGYNRWTGNDGGVFQGIVSNTLGADGYPTMSNSAANVRGSSLAYLFNGQQAYGVTSERPTLNHLFQFCDVDGNNCGTTAQGNSTYYTYDSSKNFASLQDDGNFKVYNKGRFQNGLPSSEGAFMPFNDLSDQMTDYGSVTGHRLTADPDYNFGMDVSTKFIMPKGGKVNGQNMKFSFAGDDDVWVFVDGVLVLDLGGIHDNYGGSIDFATGEVVTGKRNNGSYQNYSNTTIKEMFEAAGKTWDDSPYATHTLKFFYIERGQGSSNCKLSFNLPTIPDGVIDIAKQITDTSGGNVNDFSNAEFTMQVSTADTENGQYVLYANQPYAVYRIGTTVTSDTQPLRTDTTDDNGQFKLKNGEFARLTGQVQHDGDTAPHAIKQTMYYKIVELAADGYSKDDYTFNVNDADYKAQDDTKIGASDPVSVDQHPYTNVLNKFKRGDKYYTFAAKKVMAAGQTSDGSFTLKVVNGDGTAYNGNFYYMKDNRYVNKDGDDVATQNDAKAATSNGEITLKAGMEAHILGVAPGTTFKVEELNLDADKYVAPTYTCGTAQASEQACTVTVDSKNQKGSITVTNSLKTAKLTLVKKVDNTYAGKWGAAPNAWKLTATTYEGEKDPGFSGVPSENVAGQSSDTALAVPQHEVPAGKYWIDENSNFDYRHSSFPNEEYPYSSGYQMSLTNCTAADGKGVTFDKDAETVTLKAGQDVTCIVTNTALPGSVTWSKTDAADKRLGGSEWTLVGPDGKPSVTVKDKYDGQDGALDTDTRPGEFKVENLHWGQYTLTESKAPEGFAMSKDSTTFAVVPAYQQGDSNYAASDPAQPGKDPSVCTIAPMDSSTLVQSSGALDVNCPAVVNYPAVSSLPLTGGTTGRQWLMAGGGMGFAVLLAGAGYTIWRKRQLI